MSFLGPMALGAFARNNDPYRRRLQNIEAMTHPDVIERDARNMFQRNLSSPALNMARSEIIGAGQSAQSAMQQNLARQGLLQSGVGNAGLAAAAAAPGIHLGRLTAGAWEMAQRQAQGAAFQRAGIIGGMPQEQNHYANFGAAGMNAFLPYLFWLMSQNKYPGANRGFGTPAPDNQYG